MKKNILIAIMLFMTIVSKSQEFLDQTELIRKLGVTEMETYDFIIEDRKTIGKDSVLIDRNIFNRFGFILQNLSYQAGSQVGKQDYTYRKDSLLVKKTTVYTGFDNRMVLKKKYKYGKKNEIKFERYFVQKRLASQVKSEYNQEGFLCKKITENKENSKNNKEIIKYFYDKSNQLVRQESNGYTYPAIELEYDETGNHITTIRIDKNGNKIKYLDKEYDDNGLLVKIITHFQHDTKMPVYNGEVQIRKGDIVMNRVIRSRNGLIKREEQYLNGKLVRIRKNNYAP